MQLLLTGGAGFIGSNFIRYWLNQHPKDTITNLDSLTYAGNLANLADIDGSANYSFVRGDICDAEIVGSLVNESDQIVHFAAESHVDRSILGPSAFVETNIKGTFTLLEAARQNNTPFHHVSTDEVFGSLPLDSREKFTESTPYDPKSPYSASKASSDHLVRAYHATYNLPITITNCSNNFGPYQHPEKFISRMITNLIDDQPVKIYGDGLYVRDWLYVNDHARAIDLIISGDKSGLTYLVGGMSVDINNLNVAKILLSHLSKGEEHIEYVKDRPGHDRRYAVDWSKLQQETGWQPEHSFEEWLKETVKWYQENESWWRPLKEESEKMYKKTGQ